MTRKIVIFLLCSLLLILVYSIFILTSIKYLQANPLAFALYFTLMIFILLIFIALIEAEYESGEYGYREKFLWMDT